MWPSLDGSRAVVSALLAITGAAAVTDSRTGRIPNWLTVPAIVGGASLAWVRGSPVSLFDSASGVLACAVVPVLLFSRGAMGGGDAKLFAALGAALGPSSGLGVQVVAYVAAAAYVLVAAVRHGRLGRTLASALRLSAGVVSRRPDAPRSVEHPENVRMGVFIFAATAVCLAPTLWGEP